MTSSYFEIQRQFSNHLLGSILFKFDLLGLHQASLGDGLDFTREDYEDLYRVVTKVLEHLPSLISLSTETLINVFQVEVLNQIQRVDLSKEV